MFKKLFKKKEKIVQILFSPGTEKSDQQFMALTNKGFIFRMEEGEWKPMKLPSRDYMDY